MATKSRQLDRQLADLEEEYEDALEKMRAAKGDRRVELRREVNALGPDLIELRAKVFEQSHGSADNEDTQNPSQ